MKKLLPVILLLIGAGGGVGAGLFLRPAESDHNVAVAPDADTSGDVEMAGSAGAADSGDSANASTSAAATANSAGSGPEYVALQRQMIVPIVSNDQVISLVVLSLSVEVEAGFGNDVYDREPKLRDAFLQVLFRHANTGGFNGDFTTGEKMSDLRRALNGAAAQVLGPVAIQVLVTDILRQET